MCYNHYIMKNYHTHTKRCRHAEGSDKAYVSAAIQNGFDEIGFSDHAPMLFPKSSLYYSGFRMFPREAKGYISSIERLKKEFQNEIIIHKGFELEYYPKLFGNELEFLKSLNIDYLILGQHYNLNEYESAAHYSGSETKETEKLDLYIAQCTAALETEKFTYIAHPDLIHFTGDKDFYKERMFHFCSRIKELGYPVEFNMLGFIEKRNYPSEDFWKIAKLVGNKVIIGLDAHTPKAFEMHSEIKKAKAYLNSLGISVVESVELIKP